MQWSALYLRVYVFGAVLFFMALPHFSYAQSADAVVKRQAELQAELDATNKDIAYWAGILASKETETASISRDIAILTAKIAEAKATIKAKNIIIQQLGRDIGEKVSVIKGLNQKLDKQIDSLSELIRKANELENYSLVEVVLSGQNLSGFLGDLDTIQALQGALKISFQEIKATRAETETMKEALSKRQAIETDARKTIEAEQRQIQKNEAQKKELLAISKTEEKTYKSILSDRQKRAAQIRSALFALRDSAAIPYGTAYGYALEVQKKTGVRPAFLLAILTQETNLGENVGQCLVKNLSTGDGVGKNTGTFFSRIMKRERAIPPFIGLAERLGFDPTTKPVSCPQKGGYGGAMGPSQFIPSTWVSFEKRIAKASGASTPDPWIPRDAFFASGIYLSDLGADAGGYSAESTAAAKYYAGSAWKTRGKAYGASVMSLATNIQENMIDPLKDF